MKAGSADAIGSLPAMTLTAREAVLAAEAANAASGHENLGSLSLSHGFAPRLTPLARFPPAYAAWDRMAARVPELLSSGRLRRYCDEELPELDAGALPPAYAMRAVLVLGYAAHAYWNLGGTRPARALPEALELPWREASRALGRETPFLGYSELFVHNFAFREGAGGTGLPPGVEKCPWGSAELEAYGAHDYDPKAAIVPDLVNRFSVSGTREEEVFNLVMSEVHCAGADMVRLVVEAQEAAAAGDYADLKRCLVGLTEVLNLISYQIFARNSQVEKAPTYVGGAVWAKIIGAVAIPMFSENIGPGPTTAPFIHLFDNFFRRKKYEHFVGKDVVRLLPSLPAHWKTFLLAVRNGPNIGEYCDASDDEELKGLYGACLRSFAGGEGFLGRHQLKMYGYLEVVMKLGRTITIAGFGGSFRDRSWDKIMAELKIGQAERFDVPLGVTSTRVHRARLVKQRRDEMEDAWGELAHIRIDISGCGIRYRPGSRVGVLLESGNQQVNECLLALAAGDEMLASELGEEPATLSDEWRRAVRYRPPYHAAKSDADPIIPATLPLREFLKYAELRPVTRRMLHAAYRACGSQFLRQILENNLETSLQFSDVIKLMQQTGVCVFSTSQNREKCSCVLNAHQEIVFKNIAEEHSNSIELYELVHACAAAGVSIDSSPEIKAIVRKYEGSLHLIELQEFKDQFGHIFGRTELCDLVPPAKFRVYSVASSPQVTPNEISLYISHVSYDQVDPSTPTTPLLAGMHPPTHRFGAGSDYLVRGSMSLSGLAIEAARYLSSKNQDGRIPHSDATMHHLMHRGGLTLEQAHDVMDDYTVMKINNAKKRNDISLVTDAILDMEKNYQQSPPEEVVLIHFEPPRFRLPETESDAPVVMIAGGTGLAPFRGFWQERVSKPSAGNGPRDLLILQMRSRAEIPSYLGKELSSLVRSGKLDVEIMLSQEEFAPCWRQNGISWEPVPGRKGYIGSLIKGPLQDKITLLVRDYAAHLYVCGRGAVAKTALDALDESLSEMFGEDQDILERMVATERVSLEVFSTNRPPPKDVEYTNLSYLCTCNDFVGNRGDGSKPLLMVINDFVYDVTPFLSLHPGGAPIMHLYCGMDATKAWNGVDHDKAPEVQGMLEMYNTGKVISTRHVATSLGTNSVRFWYMQGWSTMADVLVETQNVVALSYQRIWDMQAFTTKEEQKEKHWCGLNGKFELRNKQSIYKGQRFLEIHQRMWLSFLPLLFGDEFSILSGGISTDRGDKNRRKTRTTLSRGGISVLAPFMGSSAHDACGAFCSLLEEDINAEAALSRDGYLSSGLQAVMEEVRFADETLLEDMKAGIVMGLVAFEEVASCSACNNISDLGNGPALGVQALKDSLQSYLENVALLTNEYFGKERVTGRIKLLEDENSAARGGLHLIGGGELTQDFMKRTLIDTDEEITVKFGGDSRAHDDDDMAEKKCHFARVHDDNDMAEKKCPFG